MNYINIYKNIVKNAQNRNLEGYKEVHHIKPRCMGGKDTEDNLVDLTAREHFIAHWLLIKIYPNNGKLHNAFWMMAHCRGKNRYRCSSVAYEIARKGHAEAVSVFHKGKKLSDETKLKMSEIKKGINHFSFKGWYCTPVGRFESSREAAKHNGCSNRSILNWCKSGKNGYSFVSK